jgi:hypothetical protein
MLSPMEAALAIFGCYDDPVVVNIANSLAGVSGFSVVIRPPSDNPALTLLCVKLFGPLTLTDISPDLATLIHIMDLFNLRILLVMMTRKEGMVVKMRRP